MKRPQAEITALISLLEDDDRQVSSMAMEQLLMLDREADTVVAEFQEADSPVLRNRIHQIGSILKIRRSRLEFLRNLQEGAISLWDGLIEINHQCDPRMNRDAVKRQMHSIRRNLPRRMTPQRLSRLMREAGFACPGEDVLGADLYLVEDVLEQRLGAPIVFCALAQALTAGMDYPLDVVLMHGKHCLLDGGGNLIDVSQGWDVGKLGQDDRVHKCTDRQVWRAALGQLFLSALLEGRLHFIYRVGSILSSLCDEDFSNLPFPLGS